MITLLGIDPGSVSHQVVSKVVTLFERADGTIMRRVTVRWDDGLVESILECAQSQYDNAEPRR